MSAEAVEGGNAARSARRERARRSAALAALANSRRDRYHVSLFGASRFRSFEVEHVSHVIALRAIRVDVRRGGSAPGAAPEVSAATASAWPSEGASLRSEGEREREGGRARARERESARAH